MRQWHFALLLIIVGGIAGEGCAPQLVPAPNIHHILRDRSTPSLMFWFENHNWDTIAWADSLSQLVYQQWAVPVAYTEGSADGNVELSFRLTSSGEIEDIQISNNVVDERLMWAALEALMEVQNDIPAPGAGFSKSELVKVHFMYPRKYRVQ